MSSSSSTSATSLSYTHPSPNPVPIGRYNMAHQIITTRSANGEDPDNNHHGKRKVATTQSSSGHHSPLEPSPPPPSGPTLPDARGPTMPTIHLRATSEEPSPEPIPKSPTDSFHLTPITESASSAEDLYNNLSSFKFGTTQSSSVDTDADGERISPLTSMSNSFSDRTPRPSVSIQVRDRGHSLSTKHDPSTTNHSHPPQPHGKSNKSKRRVVVRTDPSSPISGPDGSGGSSGSEPSSEHEPCYSPQGGPDDDDPMSDRASLHTFGPSTSMAESSGASLSSRASSRIGYDNTEFSSDEESDYPFDDEVDVSPVVFARGPRPGGLSSSGEETSDFDDEPKTTVPPPESGRRGSLPIAIPGARAERPLPVIGADIGRDREDSLITLRRPSRSLDDELSMFATLNAGKEPKSEPLSKGDWRVLEEKQRDREKQKQGDEKPSISGGDGVYDGLDMSYILGGSSWGSPTYSASRRSSDTPSYIQPSPKHGSTLAFWAPSGGRRPSTATMATTGSAIDDSFDRYVKRWDTEYAGDVAEWSFKREKADGAGTYTSAGVGRRASNVSGSTPRASISGSITSGGLIIEGGRSKTRDQEKEKVRYGKTMVPGMQEIWRNEMVGRFKVDRQEILLSDNTKPPQHRLSIRHIIDPYSKGNIRGGPGLMVHRHSRAIAFSLYRAYHMYISSQRDAAYLASKSHLHGTTGKRSAANILLAPKHVQQEYTNTKSVGTLQSHGHLDDGNGGRSPVGRRRASSAGRRAKEREREQRQERERQKEEEKRRKREREEEKKAAKLKGKRGTDSQTSSMGSMSSDSWVHSTNSPPPVPPKDLEPFVPPVEHTYPPQPPNIHRHLSAKRVNRPGTASDTSSFDDHSSVVGPSRRGADIVDMSDLDGQRPAKTPHSEAFDTLDPNVIEYVRNRPEHRSIQPESGHSLTSRMTRLWPLGQKRSSHMAVGSTSASREGSFRPPWMTLAERTQVESQERVVQNVSTSFKDVGLLPTGRPSHRRSEKTPGRKQTRDIFNQVPDDSLYMLLPLWPAETDPASTVDCEFPCPPLEDRTYLLVYYVPFLEQNTNKKKHVAGKGKRSLTPPTETSSTDSSSTRGLYLSSFRVDARLVGYDELRGSGIRLPGEGLAVTGPIAEALASCPTPSIRAANHHDVVIAKCFGRDKGFEFDRNGLEKLGLCSPVPGSDLERSPTDGEPIEPELLLSAIGRAVVEMAWLGGMALTCFG